MTSPIAAAPFDPQAFKAVMRKIAGTVTVIATASATGLHGMTATAMCSVSAEPPMVLIVVNRSARTHLHIDTKKAFTVSILGEDQLDVANLFAGKDDHPFAQVAHRLLADGCPVIEGAAAHVHCMVESQLDAGTHTIFVGRVLDADASAALPLLYQDARYGRLAGD
ncbi:FMN reductase (NADH) NtaB [Beijerinckiaceae bacterium RH AL1]|jgi:flavin reductase|nr:flavin reductase family protein [Beijerinckiaceae bacterium]VVB42926.1 FMN reductase (NADH) NtaB [Beijerinckiaceae bacterium RH AL8]VVB42938.1 FMN reductase (NADH) NtaB [Beijerinckiaceae bacterium RH CH11]VVC53577.1 FMN reductase (NADH) NtaB [Beijerinckiaceae bacterium RH AL1]